MMDSAGINSAWILDNTGIPFGNVFVSGMVALAVIGMAVLIYFILKSGQGYSNDDADAHAEDYAGTIREAHGGLTAFLIISFSAIFIWTVVYFVINWSQFLVIFQNSASTP